MNGEIALLCPKMMRTPTRISIITMGVSHQAFRSLRKSKDSARMVLFPAICLREGKLFLNISLELAL